MGYQRPSSLFNTYFNYLSHRSSAVTFLITMPIPDTWQKEILLSNHWPPFYEPSLEARVLSPRAEPARGYVDLRVTRYISLVPTHTAVAAR